MNNLDPKMSSSDDISIESNDSAMSLDTKPEILSNDGSENEQVCEKTSLDSTFDPDDRVFEIENSGISSLVDQVLFQLSHKGISFNLMAVGRSGVGKSTLLDSLFKTNLSELSPRTGHQITDGVDVHYFDLKERNVKLRLGLIESKGFDDQFDAIQTLSPIVDYIHQQYDRYLNEEQKVCRNLSVINDTRIDVCLYLISSTGIRTIDLIAMKKLSLRTNLIPVITKADTLTKEEVNQLKAHLMSEINSSDIKIYSFPTDDSETGHLNDENNGLLPFAVIASNEFVEIDTIVVRARQYVWGTVEVLDKTTSDFVRLRDMIIRFNMSHLKERALHYYEIYRECLLRDPESDYGTETD